MPQKQNKKPINVMLIHGVSSLEATLNLTVFKKLATSGWKFPPELQYVAVHAQR